MVDSFDPHGSYGVPILFPVHKGNDRRSDGSVSILSVLCSETDEICEEGAAAVHQVLVKARKERTSQLGQPNRFSSI